LDIESVIGIGRKFVIIISQWRI